MTTFVRGAAIALALCLPAAVCLAQPAQQGGNQTQGFGDGKVLTFTYTQNFDCVEQPKDDLNFSGNQAENAPGQLQTPICQAGFNPTINPPGMTGGKATADTDPIYVLVPLFSVNNDQNPADAISCKGTVKLTICGTQLGKALIGFFGALPEAWKASPMVYTQCPNPGLPPGTCTMHASRIDLAPVLAKLGYIGNPPTMNVFVPSPNHSHVLLSDQINFAPEWWQVIPVLVLDASDWPAQDGSSGITSYAAIKAAEKAGDAIEAPSNFFLYFGSKVQGGKMDMSQMNMGQQAANKGHQLP